jgi:hypothetical protein
LKIKLLLSGILLFVFALTAHAEDKPEEPSPPDSEIHLFDLSTEDGRYIIKNGVNISNNSGYDNQPFFTESSETLLFVSNRDGKQTDVYEYDLNTNKTIQLTKTAHSEYSPKTIDNTSISFVSEGGNPYQSVWKLNRSTGKSTWLLNSKEPVGYYSANSQTGDVLFWSRYGWSVQYLNIKRDQARFVSGNVIPSSPQQIPNSDNFSFVHRQTNGEVWIKSFNPNNFAIIPLAPMEGTNYDYTWAPNGDMLRVEQKQLFVWPNKNISSHWQKGLSLSQYFKGKISRLAISADGKKIALVENR